MASPSAGRDVAVVGAGVAGLVCATRLRAAGARVTVFDKARGPGGRASTRRSPAGGFDHGAQYLTARSPGFREAVARWEKAGVLARWPASVLRLAPGGRLSSAPGADPEEARWVGTPRMSAWLRHLAGELPLETGARVEAVERRGGGWRLRCAGGASPGPFSAVVLATPAEQAVPLLAAAPALAGRAAAVATDPCWAVMLGFAGPIAGGFEAALVEGSPLAWAARDSGKPGRAPGERWVLHAGPAWTRAHLDAGAPEVVRALGAAFAEALGRALPEPVHADAQRWLYARTRTPLGAPFLLDAALGLGACGDWCLGARVEYAFESGARLGAALAGPG